MRPPRQSPADTAPAADDSGFDDLFNDAATEAVPADTSPAADDSNLDDLFNDAGSNEAPSEDLDDLFSSNRPVKTRQISFVASERTQPLRAWLDNTGRYRTVGRLIFIGEDHVSFCASRTVVPARSHSTGSAPKTLIMSVNRRSNMTQR